MDLSVSRYLNLVYWFMVRGLDDEGRKKVDDSLYDAGRSVNGSAPKKKTPSWWRGDQTAATSSLEAARQLGFMVGQVT